MKAILGIIEATSGGIEIFGCSPRDIGVQRRIGFMPENTYLYKYLTGDEFLDFNGRFYDLTGVDLAERKNWALEKVGLTEARHKKLNTYSKGMLQRI
jgi:ABC-2 type transport system ATP-binding protein